MSIKRHVRALALMCLVACQLSAQAKPRAHRAVHHAKPELTQWSYNLTVDGYLQQGQDGYATPTFTADRKWLHLEARYDSEYTRTGSLWIGRDFQWGKKLVVAVTPVLGGVFGSTHGIAPGCEASVTYKKLSLSISSEYVFNTDNKASNFYSGWPQLTYSALKWFRLGLVAQTNKAYQSKTNLQGGLFIGFVHKNLELTTYAFNLGRSNASVVLETGISF